MSPGWSVPTGAASHHGSGSASRPGRPASSSPGALSWTTVFDVPPQLVLGAELVVPPARWQAPLYDVTIHVPLTSSPVMDDVVAGSDENRLHQDSGGPVR